MRPRSVRRTIFATAVAFALFSLPRAASADWISLSSSTPPPPGQLGGWDRLLLWMGATGTIVPMVYAGALAVNNQAPPDSAKRDAGLLLGGGLTGALFGVFLPWVEPGEPAFTITLVGGMFMGMGGVGMGGAVSSSPRALWLGGSMGYGTFALYRMILSFTGHADYRGAAAAQIVLGVIGTTGCLIDTAAATGAELYIAYGCGGVSAVTTIHGMLMVARRDRPRPPVEKPDAAAFYPVPWFGRDAGGLSIAGSF